MMNWLTEKIQTRLRADFRVTLTLLDLILVIFVASFLIPPVLQPTQSTWVVLQNPLKVFNFSVLLVALAFGVECQLKVLGDGVSGRIKQIVDMREGEVSMIAVIHALSLNFDYSLIETMESGLLKVIVETAIAIMVPWFVILSTIAALYRLRLELLDLPWIGIKEACRLSDIGLLKDCLQKLSSINAYSQTHKVTPLSLAAESLNVKMVNFLLEQGADPSYKANDVVVLEEARIQPHMLSHIQQRMQEKQEREALDKLINDANMSEPEGIYF